MVPNSKNTSLNYKLSINLSYIFYFKNATFIFSARKPFTFC